MKLYFLPLCVAVILWGCGHDKEKKREDSEAAKAEYVAERNVVDTVGRGISINKSSATGSCGP